MGLADKLRRARDLPDDTDLLEFFGVRPGEFRVAGGLVVAGDEAVPLAEARAILCGFRGGGTVHGIDGEIVPPRPGRTVRIEDL